MIEIKLNEQGVYEPGQTISGYVRFTNITANADSLEVRLIWYTSGKGDRDCEIIASTATEKPNTNGEVQFSFPTPFRPYSFSGQLVSLTWAIEAIVFPGLESQQQEVVISANGKEVMLFDE